MSKWRKLGTKLKKCQCLWTSICHSCIKQCQCLCPPSGNEQEGCTWQDSMEKATFLNQKSLEEYSVENQKLFCLNVKCYVLQKTKTAFQHWNLIPNVNYGPGSIMAALLIWI